MRNEPEAFFATLFHLLQERLGERLESAASAITEAIVEERLCPLRVPTKLWPLCGGCSRPATRPGYAARQTTERGTLGFAHSQSGIGHETN